MNCATGEKLHRDWSIQTQSIDSSLRDFDLSHHIILQRDDVIQINASHFDFKEKENYTVFVQCSNNSFDTDHMESARFSIFANIFFLHRS